MRRNFLPRTSATPGGTADRHVERLTSPQGTAFYTPPPHFKTRKSDFEIPAWHLCLLVLLFSTFTLYGYGIRRPTSPPGVVPVIEPTYSGLEQFFADSTLLKSRFSSFSRKYEIDSTKQYIFISEKLFDFDYRLPIGMELGHYAQQRIKHDDREKWKETVLRNLKRTEAGGAGGIELNIPVRIKSKTFKRIFGGDRVGLRVTGNISFELAGRSEDRSGAAVSSLEESGNFSPKFHQTQQFRVEGRVGDKVSVSVDQNSEATFDFENTLKLVYDGDDDEIVQAIEAGNVALNLPSTNYVSTSANHQGLFGLKTQMKVGNLGFTGIASLERGENQKISKTGSASEKTFRLKDIEYTRNKFFFVDSTYIQSFENFDPQMRPLINTNLSITQLDVWITTELTDQERRSAWAVLDPRKYTSGDSLPSTEIDGIAEDGNFRRLIYQEEYDYDEYRGFFWINANAENNVIAVAYATSDGDTVGNIFTGDTTQTDTLIFKLIKPRTVNPANSSTWKLSMRNVYNLGGSSIPQEGFDVRVLFAVTGEDQEVEVQSGKTFNYLMGLDRIDEQGNALEGGDKKLDRNGSIFNLSSGYMIFPSLTPFAPQDSTYFNHTQPSNFNINPENYVEIYDINNNTLAQQLSKFEIEITSTSVSSTFELGFNVLEGSEIVRLNGRTLARDKDYTIDYFSGSLQVIAPEARRADAQIDIEYERASIFQLDKKTLLGGRLEYQLGKDDFIGLTALYFNQSTLDQRIRVGQEPIRNFVWDVNTSLSFQPNFITTLFDKLPIVETSAESRLKIEAEYAEVNPNPNTFEEKSLNEKGVAYIDDFEGSKRATSMGIIYRTWSFASIPQRFKIQERDTVDYVIPFNSVNLMMKMDASRLRMNWYNPFNQVPIQDIWPERDVNTQTGTTTNVLNLRWKNDNISPDSAWSGIMRSTVTFPDQKKTKFIEIWLKPRLEGISEDTKAQINIDIGYISEDYWIRGNRPDGVKSFGNLNTEDQNLNGLLDEGEDIGIDGIPNGAAGDDPNDNWSPPRETAPEFLGINGTEGNGEQKTARYPDTEDLDGDGDVRIVNHYFEYSFDLADEDNPYIQGRTQRSDGSLTGWRLYRIPIRNYNDEDVIGNPDREFQEIVFVRIWVNNIPQESVYRGVQIAAIDFVGSDWEEQGILYKDTTRPGYVIDDSLFSITVYNDEENTVDTPEQEGYHSPPDVSGVEDRITKAVSKEQSLVLQLHELEGDGTVAEAKKQLGQKMNLVHYRTLKMFVHGDRNLPMQDSPLEFYIRFGSTLDNYYEYGEKVYPHWDGRNEIILDFDELTQTRQEIYQIDSTQQVFFRTDPKNAEKYFRVVGKPGLHNINYFIFGARNVGQATLRDMEIWVDELRVTDIEREKGSAMRLSTDLTVADIGRVTAQWELIDDNFRRIEQQFPSTDGRDKTQEKQSYVANVNLDKFLPEAAGMDIRVDGRYTKTRSVPKYFYNSDRKTHYEFSSFSERLEAFFGLNKLSEELDETSDHSETRAVGATIKRKNRPRDPWYLKYTVNQVQMDVDVSEKHSRNPTTLFNDTKSISGRFNYSLQFGRDNFIKPFGWLGKARVLKPITSQKLYFTPTNSSFGFSLSDNETNRQNRLELEPTQTISVGTNRQFGISYKLTDNIDVGLNRSYKSDAYTKGYRAKDVIENIFTNFDFGEDLNVTQRFTVDYRPKFFDWMTQSFRYSTDFGYNLANPKTTRDRSSRSTVNKQFSFDLKPTVLANKIYSPKPAAKQSPPKPKPGSSEDDEPGKSDGESQDEKKSKIPQISIPNPAVMLWKFFDAWKSINVDLNLQDDYTNFNLTEIPKWKYQFGFSPDPEVDTTLAGNTVPVLPGISKRRGINSGLQFDIIKNLSSTFRYQYDETKTRNNQRQSESISNSYFFTGEDPEENKKGWWDYVPDWSLRLSGVEKFLFFGALAQTMSVEHSRSGKFSETARIEGENRIRDQWSFSNSYQPLIGVNLNTLFGVTSSIRFTRSTNYNYNPTGAVTRSQQSGLNITASYSVVKGFRIPIPFINMKSLKNEIQFSLAFDKSGSQTFAKSANDDKFVERDVNKNWKIRPSATYRFSQKVNGTAFFEKGQSENKRTGVYSYFEFGINVNISIR